MSKTYSWSGKALVPDTGNRASGSQSYTLDSESSAIRFPHIPSRHRTLPGEGDYRMVNGHLMRIDRSHEASDEILSQPPQEKESVQLTPPSQASTGEFTPNTDVAPFANDVTTEQVSQIAEYLRRKRDELEAENTELAINGWQQQQWILEQKELLRRNSAAIRRTQSLVEAIRCDLIEMGHCLEQDAQENSASFDQFNKLCKRFFELHHETNQLR
ncbi:MAG: hypothetical protein R3C03_08550 [Pirellulaceae bacterium]